MKKILIFGALSLLGLTSYGQQDAMYTHYAFNTLTVNPAYAGSRDALTITGLHRSQWVGFEGAPTTQTLTLHAPVFNNRVGLGLSVLNDKIGPTNTTSLYADVAYRIPVTEKGTLSFGVKGGINIAQQGLNDLDTDQDADNSFSQNLSSGILPNFGAGVYYSTDKWYVGASTPKIIENKFETGGTGLSNDVASEQRHFFLIAGTVFDLNESIKLKPTTFLKVTEAASPELDLTGMFIFNDKLELGAMFRTGDAVGALIGYNFNTLFRIGYSFDWSWNNQTFKYNNGSHEIMLRYDAVFRDNKKIRSPRYF